MDDSVNLSEKAKEEIKPWIRRLARSGYMAKGVVYTFIGVLAFMAALGIGGKATGTTGMLRSLAQAPFGNLLLWLVGIGLIFYIMWVFIKAVKDPKDEGRDAKGVITRVGYSISGLIYSSLAYNAFNIAINATRSSGSKHTLSAKLLSHPFGAWIICFIGIIVIGYGLYELYSGISQKFLNKFRMGEMDRHERKVAKNSGTIGMTARGIVLAMIGFFFIQTGIMRDPSKARGLDGALAEVAQNPFGQWMLGFVALGLVLYGIYQIIRGRYEHMSFGRLK
ncbi:DUF1206 domain-containing protein [Halobacillus naozhouensis]|uniref:DUF1206 domain-containing protein n=1 Tax=Halobacillus naozhouensis TaxID=554880 RepID=A0ABY8IZK7_9BACI|nr:DUF1206 domain-containing protein [Halobacillus naozhouensis]WFT75505.1 DUF1206 domain-containing protein [Halobacillus naozhouensis]